MAGDWIKMRGNLWDDPRISALVDATDTGEAAVIGGLYWLWSAADQHTEDGVMPGLTLRQIDRKTGIPGFGAALCAIGWVLDDPLGVKLANFEEHNGTSAKRRCTDAHRKATTRNASASHADKPRTDGGQIPPNLGAREEKRREEINKDKPPSEVGRARRKCPQDFEITQDMRIWAALECPRVDTDRATAKFRDHTFKTAMTDWAGAWRNWLRKDAEFSPKGPTQPSEPAWRSEQRERTQQAAPGVAVKSANEFFIDVEATNVAAVTLG